MRESQLDQLKSLPQRAEDTWQGGLFPMPIEAMPESLRPLVPMWISVRSEFVHAGSLLMPDDGNLGAVVDALLDLPNHIDGRGHRPGRIEVNDSALAEHLDGLLADAGIEVRLVDRLEAVEQALDSMVEFMQRDGGPLSGPPVPGPLDGKGVSVEQLRSFAEAAADFYRAAPWQYVTDVDLIRIEKPKPPQ
ncbi:MAG TPA: hypothetical protein VE890_06400, partial [Thermoguttaceae bacterium]|nr:hypothetical protein [Thermoguttaceae bacterium]